MNDIYTRRFLVSIIVQASKVGSNIYMSILKGLMLQLPLKRQAALSGQERSSFRWHHGASMEEEEDEVVEGRERWAMAAMQVSPI